MKYRLIRFNKDSKVVLDVNTDNLTEYESTYEWCRSNQGTALLYQYDRKEWYDYNEDCQGAERLVWLPMSTEAVKQQKYIKMLELTGGL